MITAEERSHVAAIATALADLVTTTDIENAEDLLRLKRMGGNKVTRIQSLFLRRLGRGYKGDATTALRALVLRAHERLIIAKKTIHVSELEAILAPARALGWVHRELEQKGWRTAVRTTTETNKVDPNADPPPRRVRPFHHREAEKQLHELTTSAINAQERGRRLELIVLGILHHEKLRPQHSVRNTGEEIDLAFEISDIHYVAECKWEKKPAGGLELTTISAKARTRPEGTRGVLLSMMGFVEDIEDLAARGQQQNVIGLTGQHLMSVVSGHLSWSDVVLAGWRAASRHRRFVAPLGT